MWSGSHITEKLSEVGKAIVGFQYAERIKSELIIPAKMLDRLAELSGDELNGACKLYLFFLTALEGEINIALNVLGMNEFETAAEKVRAAMDKAQLNQYDECMKLISEAISHIASTGQWSMQILKDHNLL